MELALYVSAFFLLNFFFDSTLTPPNASAFANPFANVLTTSGGRNCSLPPTYLLSIGRMIICLDVCVSYWSLEDNNCLSFGEE